MALSVLSINFNHFAKILCVPSHLCAFAVSMPAMHVNLWYKYNRQDNSLRDDYLTPSISKNITFTQLIETR